nr:unnamed protein product [Callosobruchus chinensis]
MERKLKIYSLYSIIRDK